MQGRMYGISQERWQASKSPFGALWSWNDVKLIRKWGPNPFFLNSSRSVIGFDHPPSVVLPYLRLVRFLWHPTRSDIIKHRTSVHRLPPVVVSWITKLHNIGRELVGECQRGFCPPGTASIGPLAWFLGYLENCGKFQKTPPVHG
jgi:hypothetical protein